MSPLRVTAQTGKSFVVPPGLSLKPRVTVEGEVGPDIDAGHGGTFWNPIGGLEAGELLHLELDAEYSAAAGRYIVARLSLRAIDDGPEVTGALLRTVRVREVLRFAVQQSVKVIPPAVHPDIWADQEGDLIEAFANGGPRGDVGLRATATAYRLAEIQNDNPGQYVAEIFGLSRRTATNWIKRARERGFFEGN